MRSFKFFLAAAVLLTLFSCNKEENSYVDYNANVLAAKESTLMKDITAEIVTTLLRAGYDTSLHNAGQGEIGDATIFYDKNADSVTIRVFYPHWALLGDDKIYRQGEYVLKLDKDLYEQGASGTIELTGYGMHRRSIKGSMRILHSISYSDNHPLFELSIDSFQMQTEDSVGIIKYTADNEFIWATGFETPLYYGDDLIHFNGTSSGTTSSGVAYETEIANPIGITDSCYWLFGGTYNITTPSATVKEGSVEYFEDEGCSSLFNMYFDTFTMYEEFYYLYNPPELN